MDWINVAQDRDRWRALVNAGYFLTSWAPVTLSGRTLLRGVNNEEIQSYIDE